MAYAMVLCFPYVWWSSVYEKDLYDKLQFVMAGLEEALTTTIHGIAKMTDKSRRAEGATKDFTIINLPKDYMQDETVKQSETSKRPSSGKKYSFRCKHRGKV